MQKHPIVKKQFLVYLVCYIITTAGCLTVLEASDKSTAEFIAETETNHYQPSFVWPDSVVGRSYTLRDTELGLETPSNYELAYEIYAAFPQFEGAQMGPTLELINNSIKYLTLVESNLTRYFREAAATSGPAVKKIHYPSWIDPDADPAEDYKFNYHHQSKFVSADIKSINYNLLGLEIRHEHVQKNSRGPASHTGATVIVNFDLRSGAQIQWNTLILPGRRRRAEELVQTYTNKALILARKLKYRDDLRLLDSAVVRHFYFTSEKLIIVKRVGSRDPKDISPEQLSSESGALVPDWYYPNQDTNLLIEIPLKELIPYINSIAFPAFDRIF